MTVVSTGGGVMMSHMVVIGVGGAEDAEGVVERVEWK